MAVDPNNPALPLPSTQVEVAAELRGIKGVMKVNKENIAALQLLLGNVTTLTPWAGGLLEKTTDDQALDYLGATTVGKEIFAVESYTALADSLGVTDYSPEVNVAGAKVCINWGDLKINIIKGSFPDHTVHSWHTNFISVIYGILTTKNQDSNGSVQAFNETLGGCEVSFDGGGTKAYTLLAIGI